MHTRYSRSLRTLPRAIVVTLGVVAMFASLTLAQNLAALPAGPPRAIVLDLSGRTITGTLIKADMTTAVQMVDNGRPIVVAAAEVIWLGIDADAPSAARPVPWFADEPLPNRPPPKRPLRVAAHLRDHQVLIGTIVDQASDALLMEHSRLGHLVLPFNKISRLDFDGEGPSQVVSRGPASQPERFLDSIVLGNGDCIEGIVRQIGPHQVLLESVAGDGRELPAESVRGIQFAQGAAAVSVPSSRPEMGRLGEAWLHLGDGQTIRAVRVVYEPAHAAATFAYNDREVFVPVADLVGIEPISPRWQWLTAISPSRYAHQPLLAPQTGWRADATFVGTIIHWNNWPVLHGIGVPAGSHLQYDLGGAWRLLLIWPLLDDSATPGSTCTATIRLDDREVWTGAVKPATTQPAAMIPLAGKRDLLLLVQTPPTGDVLTRFVWGWAVLVR